MWLVPPRSSDLVLLFSLAVTLVPRLFSQDVSLSDVNPAAAYTLSSFLKFLTSSDISLKTVSVFLSWKSKGEGKVGYFSFVFFKSKKKVVCQSYHRKMSRVHSSA